MRRTLVAPGAYVQGRDVLSVTTTFETLDGEVPFVLGGTTAISTVRTDLGLAKDLSDLIRSCVTDFGSFRENQCLGAPRRSFGSVGSKRITHDRMTVPDDRDPVVTTGVCRDDATRSNLPTPMTVDAAAALLAER